jgi:hypothetical protein
MKIICLDHEVVALWQGARLKRYSAGRVAQPEAGPDRNRPSKTG